MTNIYQVALNEKISSIMEVIAKLNGYGTDLDGLTADTKAIVQNMAEQAIFDWAVASKTTPSRAIPVTNLQHLLHEYCTIADYV